MPRIRGRADHVRLELARRRNHLRNTNKSYPSKDDILARNHATFDNVLYHLTDDDILSISDNDLLHYDDWEADVLGPLSGDFLIQAIPGWDPSDVFFKEMDDELIKSSKKGLDRDQNLIPPKSHLGRGPADWWPEALGQFGDMVARNEEGESQSKIIERLLERMEDAGFEPSRTTLQPGIKRFMELQKL